MPRPIEVVKAQEEDIVSYEHNISSKFVRVLVGKGHTLVDGTFEPHTSQTYEHFLLSGDIYKELMSKNTNKPANTFRKDDLWQYIDLYRENRYKDPHNPKWG